MYVSQFYFKKNFYSYRALFLLISLLDEKHDFHNQNNASAKHLYYCPIGPNVLQAKRKKQKRNVCEKTYTQ